MTLPRCILILGHTRGYLNSTLHSVPCSHTWGTKVSMVGFSSTEDRGVVASEHRWNIAVASHLGQASRLRIAPRGSKLGRKLHGAWECWLPCPPPSFLQHRRSPIKCREERHSTCMWVPSFLTQIHIIAVCSVDLQRSVELAFHLDKDVIVL